jgi:ubiquinone/menaquinone biosynthesis C-methylase UbiE
VSALCTTGGRPFTDADAARVRAGETVRVASMVRAAPPVDEGDVIEVVAPTAAVRGALVVCRTDERFEVRRLLEHRGRTWLARAEPDGDIVEVSTAALVGIVGAVEQGDVRIDLGSAFWRAYGSVLARLPARSAGAGHGIARLLRLRRPLFPPLRMGSPASLMDDVRAAYEAEASALDLAEEFEDVERTILDRWLRPGMRLLDVGAGTGREAIAFARQGLHVTGIDVAPRAIARARERVREARATVTLVVADVQTYEPEHLFDVVYLGTGVYNHIPTRARRVATLGQVSRWLGRDGFVVLAPLLFPPHPASSRARLVDLVRRLLRAAGARNVAEPGDAYHRGLALAPVPQSFRYIRRFTRRGEIEAEIAAAGLVVLDRLDEAPVWKVGSTPLA